MAKNKVKVNGLDRALSIKAQRVIAYITLVLISIFSGYSSI